MDGKKIYSIQINGIKESIDAVESLKKQLDALDAKIIELENKKINIQGSVEVVEKVTNTAVSAAKSNASNTKSSLSEDVALEKELNKLKNEGIQLDAKIAASQEEIYKKVQATKDLYKETIADQKSIAAQERLVANAYSNTMQGMKDKLADLKTVINTTDLGDGDAIKKMTQEANELTQKLKDMEQAYGQFGRNVGNYQGAMDGATSSTDKFKIEVGAVTREFGSAREASRTLREELSRLEADGKRNTTQAKNLRTAYYNLNSAIKDATVSSKAMDTALDTMQSFTAMASVGKGFQSFFGFDNNEIGKSIQQLVALQGVLQGIEVIRKQMETREGIGKILGKGFEKIDSWTFGMKRMIVELKGVGTQARVAAAGIKALGVAMKALMSLGIAAAIALAADALQKLIGKISDWVKGNADLVNSEKLLDASINAINLSLEKRIQLNQALANAGRISQAEKETKDEEALADAIAETNKELEKRLQMAKDGGANQTFAEYTLGVKTDKDMIQDKGVSIFGGFSTEIKDLDGLIERYDKLSKAIETNKGLTDMSVSSLAGYTMTVSDCKDELNHLEQMIGGKMVKIMREFDISTKEGRNGLADFVNGIITGDNAMAKSILLRLPEIISSKNGQLNTALKGWLDIIRQFADQANSATKQLKFEEMVNNILDQADETGKRLTDKRKKELTDRYNALSDTQKEYEKKNYNDAMSALDKMQKRRNQKVSSGLKKDKNALSEAENELNNLRIQKMKDGLQKTIKQLEEERRQRLKKIKDDGVMVGALSLATNELYDKKIEDAKKEHAKELEKINQDMWRNILDRDTEATAKELDILERRAAQLNKVQEAKSAKFMNQGIGSYGIQGKETFSKKTQEAMGIVSTMDKNPLIEDTKKLIDAEREYQTALNNTELFKENARQKEEAAEKDLANTKIRVNEQLQQLEIRKTSISEEEYQKKKDELYAEYSLEIDTMAKLNDELETLEKQRTTISNEEYDKRRKDISARYQETIKVYGEFYEKINQLDIQRIGISDEEYETEKYNIEKQVVIRENALVSLKKANDEAIKLNELTVDAKKKQFDEIKTINSELYGDEESEIARNLLLQENYTSSMSTTFKQRMSAVEVYWKTRIATETEFNNVLSEKEKVLAEKRYKQALDDENKSWNEQVELRDQWVEKKKEIIEQEATEERQTLEKQLKQRIITQKQYDDEIIRVNSERDRKLNDVDAEYDKASRDLQAAHNKVLTELEQEKNLKITEIDQENLEKRKALNTQYYNDSLQEFSKFQSSISELERKQPIGYKVDFVFTNWKATNKNNQELLDSYTSLINKINEKKNQLEEDWRNGLIDKTAYESTLTELDAFAAGVGEKMDKVRQDMSLGNMIGTFLQQAQQYIQALGNSLNSLLSTIWSAQDAEYQYNMNQLQKQIDAANKLYNELDDIANQHADNMKDIESKIGDAQGDARDRLIERYNAEKQAQKQALTDKKKAQKEEEKLKKQKEREEEAQRKKEHQRQIVQAIINTALATVQGFATQPFVPVGLAMGALAASLGAAQIAIIASQKYAKGGLLEGKSHSEGGIKTSIGRTPIELEGNEYVIRKKTTVDNLPLLDYINKSERKLKLEDFVDFYGGKSKVARNVQSVRTKFADGGQLPSLRTDIEFNDRLIQSFEDYSNRPTVVQVVDILDRTQQIKEVQVMAGLQE